MKLSHIFVVEDALDIIHKQLKALFIYNYTINTDNSVNIDNPELTDIDSLGLPQLPIKFKKCAGSFKIYFASKIENLEGVPNEIQHFFGVEELDNLKTLKGSENTVCQEFRILRCKALENLDFLPTCKKSCTLELGSSKIDSLIGIENHLKFTSQGKFGFPWDQITKGGIGLLLVENLITLEPRDVFTPKTSPFLIIQKYLGRPDDIFDCQNELIEAGYEEFAKL